LIKTDVNGDEQWNHIFLGRSLSYSVIQTSDEGFAIFGFLELRMGENTNPWLVKTNNTGIEMWNRTYESGHIGHSVLQGANGEYIMTGYVSTPEKSNDILLIKTVGRE